MGTNGHGANSHKWSKLVGGPCTFHTTIGIDKCNVMEKWMNKEREETIVENRKTVEKHWPKKM